MNFLVDGQISKLSIEYTISQAENQLHNSVSIHITSKELTISSQNSPGINLYNILKAGVDKMRVYNL